MHMRSLIMIKPPDVCSCLPTGVHPGIQHTFGSQVMKFHEESPYIARLEVVKKHQVVSMITAVPGYIPQFI